MNARILELALEALNRKKLQIENEIQMLQAQLAGTLPPKKARRKKAARKMSAAARKAVSLRMKAYWAKKRAAKAKK